MTKSTDPFIVECDCGCKLRVRLPFEADKTPRCPKCSNPVPPRTLIRTAPERTRFNKICILGVLVGLIPFAWPAGFYLLGGVVLLFILTWLKLGTEVRGWSGSKRVRRLFSFNLTKGLQEGVLWALVGVFIVCLAQLLLRTSLIVVSDATVAWIEGKVFDAHSFLNSHLKLKWIIGGLVIWFVLKTLWPQTISMAQFQTFKKWSSRTLAVLTILTSFSFFSAKTLGTLEQTWVAARKEEFRQSVEKIKIGRQQLVTNAYLQDQIENTSQLSKERLKAYLIIAPNDWETLRDVGKQILKSEPPILDVRNEYPAAPQDSIAEDVSTDESIQKVDRWLNAGDEADMVAPSFGDTRRVEIEAQRNEFLLEASRTALEESLKAILGGVLGSEYQTPLRILVNSLQSSAIKTTVAKVLPRGVNSLAAARAWVKKNVQYTGQLTKWEWQFETSDNSPKENSVQAAEETPGGYFFDTDPLPGSTGWLIKHLSCQREDVRLEAAERLREMGSQLGKSDIDRIAALLDDTETRFRLAPDRMFYDTAPVGYYAAKALSGMRSSYVTRSMIRDAGKLISNFDVPHYTRLAPEWVVRTAEL